jgi:thiamine-phosphate pyrophosphorylase
VQSHILRICDANCNRCREALRVLEDYARFTLNSHALSESLKVLRHDFQRSTEALQRRAIAFRDTASDVGTGITTETESLRKFPVSVIVAAGKRVGEALRTIEEYAKLDLAGETNVAKSIESLRYRFYTIEKRIAATLTPGRERMESVRICVLITESACKLPWHIVARQSIEGGADCLQLREKHLDGATLLDRARQLVQMCRDAGVISIINDRADIAFLSGADGVHVGQTDVKCTDVRKLVGPDTIIGVSTHDLEQARQAVLDGADYIGVGPIFPSTTKPQNNLPGLPFAQAAKSQIRIPMLAISGIDHQNVPQLLKVGVRSIAVSSAVIASDNPGQAVLELKDRLLTPA